MFDLKKIIVSLLVFIFISFGISAQDGYLNLKYGISSHDSNFTATSGSPTVDEDDEGLMLSAGIFITDNIGLDVMYYDLGDTSIKVSAGDIISIDGADYLIGTSSGTISNSVDGYGLGVVVASSPTNNEFLNFGVQGKLGVHQWDKSGSTTLVHGDSIDGRFYNSGTDLYAGLGVNISMTSSIAISISYDVLGMGDNASSLDDTSSLLGLGLQVSF